MIEDIFDFFYRHTLIADCLKTLACGVVLSFVLGFSAAGVVYVFFNPELFWVTVQHWHSSGRDCCTAVPVFVFRGTVFPLLS